jgi:hypothetical protein
MLREGLDALGRAIRPIAVQSTAAV